MTALAPDAVQVRKVGLGKWESKFWTATVFLVPVVAGVWAFSDPTNHATENIASALVFFPFFYLLFGTLVTITVWIEPTDGTIAARIYGRFVRRYPLRPDSSIRLSPRGTVTQQLIFEANPHGRRGTARFVIAFVERPYANSLDPHALRTLAGTLATHSPGTTQEIVGLLRAQADHLDAGHPALTSPLAGYLSR